VANYVHRRKRKFFKIYEQSRVFRKPLAFLQGFASLAALEVFFELASRHERQQPRRSVTLKFPDNLE